MSKMTIAEVADVVENEGLGYAITGYMSSESIKDKELAELWDKAEDILQQITDILEK
jgi:hypothetical protein